MKGWIQPIGLEFGTSGLNASELKKQKKYFKFFLFLFIAAWLASVSTVDPLPDKSSRAMKKVPTNPVVTSSHDLKYNSGTCCVAVFLFLSMKS